MAERTVFARPRTTQELVLDEIRRRILAGDIRPGDPIRPDQLAAELEVSRVPVREALKILEGEGVVEYRAHHGTALASLRAGDLREIYGIRSVLEAEAVRAALPRLTTDDLDAMRTANQDMDEVDPNDLAGLAEANRRFHFALLGASAMPHLLRLIRLLWNATDHYRAAYHLDPAHRDEVRGDHAAIVDAAAARDEASLLAAIDDHRAHAIAALETTLTEEPR